jgi:hypothetical protein
MRRAARRLRARPSRPRKARTRNLGTGRSRAAPARLAPSAIFRTRFPFLPAHTHAAALIEGGAASRPAVLRETYASGVAIIEELGPEEMPPHRQADRSTPRSIQCCRSPPMKRAFGLATPLRSLRVWRGELCDPAEDRPHHRPALRRRRRMHGFTPHAAAQGFFDSPARRAICFNIAARGGPRPSSASARSAISSPIATLARSARAPPTTMGTFRRC